MLESGSWGHSVLQTPALVIFIPLLQSEGGHIVLPSVIHVSIHVSAHVSVCPLHFIVLFMSLQHLLQFQGNGLKLAP